MVSVAALGRKNRKLFWVRSNVLTLLLFPFQTYREFLQSGQIGISYADIEKSVNKFSRSCTAFNEEDLDYGKVGGREIFKRPNVLLICDTSKRGVVQKGDYLISKEDLLNHKKIKEAAIARVRHIMGLLEFDCLLSARDRFSDGFVLKDGLIERYSRVKNVFGIDRETYQAILTNVVGFIEHPGEIPPKVMANMPHLKEFKYYKWTGRAESDEDDPNPSQDSAELFDFVLPGFRRLPRFYNTPVGIVMLQILKTEHNEDRLKAIVQAVLKERFPIEEAKKVAKYQLPSEERIRGMVNALMR
jgi:hypothetical protein